ncbi:right-handed parallel beta-helix repeat-containing protein [Streptomyces fuscigenes]|uniref:right-handed parallel beta-helix repeat-containing protein n=1 Tax=Streptomyces fuscigenes TaxID=1528880 RepID=UPI001F32BDED|nr:right-handed parallel beta-helix repeat-containing protein [Streptomyces fuscigenes]MCF3962391.1 right-handed parallel beta-helix repeat-containing protein [Streptomyces fuscigenes]
MMKLQVTAIACATAALACGIGAAAPAHSARHEVRPGESIQKAVDAARAGDTVALAAGTYRQSVTITKPGITLEGAGPRTVISPAAGTAQGTCARLGAGVCVLGTGTKAVDGVRVRALTVSGFSKNGLWASGTDHLVLDRVVAEKNKVRGIAAEKSVRSVITHVTARDNGDAGVFVTNLANAEGGAADTHGTVVEDSTFTGNATGLTLRRVRHLFVRGNDVSANCAGVFVVGDESKPLAGAMTISHNRIHENNKFCPATARLSAVQGAGIVLTGAEDTVIRDNSVTGNAGTAPMSGGIVLFKSFVGVHNSHNTVRDNVLDGNKPADLANGETGTVNAIDHNECSASLPAGMC